MTLYEAALNGDLAAVDALSRKSRKIDVVHKGFSLFGGSVVSIRGGTPLLAAAAQGHREIVALLHDRGADINRADENRYTALILVSMLGQFDVLDLLIERKADLDLRDKTQSTALHYALTMRKPGAAERLIRAGANPNLLDENSRPALHHAIEQWRYAAAIETPQNLDRLSSVLGKPVSDLLAEKQSWRESYSKIIDLLLDSGADLHGRGLIGTTPLHVATEADDPRIAACLIDRGADVNRVDDHGNTPLSRSANSIGMTEFLLKAGADPNVGLNGTPRPLHLAINRGNEDVVAALLGAGADPRFQTSQGDSPLSLASAKGAGNLVRLLMSSGAVDQENQHERTLLTEKLHQAIAGADARLVRQLLRDGAGPDAVGTEHIRPLARSVGTGDAAIVKLLLDAGATVDARDHYQRTGLHEAAEGGNDAIVKLLIASGADVNAVGDRGMQGFEGWTPLMAACFEGHESTAALLIAAGANVNAQTKDRMTPLLMAGAPRKPKLVARLIKSGATRDPVADVFLEPLEFRLRMARPDWKNTVARLAAESGVKGRIVGNFRDTVLFDLARSAFTATILPAVTDELVRHVMTHGGQDERKARTDVRAAALRQATQRSTHAFIIKRQGEYRKSGALLLYAELLSGDQLMLLPTTNPLAAVSCCGPWANGTRNMLESLQELDAAFPFDLHGCGHATLMLAFKGRQLDTGALAKRLFRFGSDERGVIVQGTTHNAQSTRDLAESMSSSRPVVRLWWD